MKTPVVVCDFDETLSEPGGVIPNEVIEGLQSFKEKGGRIVIASGRPLGFLIEHAGAFDPDVYIAENGNILYTKSHGKTVFEDGSDIVSLFKSFGNGDFEIKETIVEMPVKYRQFVEDTLRVNGVAAHVEDNKSRIMVVPPSVHKSRAVREALRLVGALRENAIGFGDGENDSELFQEVDTRVAVSNAAETLKNEADYVTSKPYGYGVLEFLEGYFS